MQLGSTVKNMKNLFHCAPCTLVTPILLTLLLIVIYMKLMDSVSGSNRLEKDNRSKTITSVEYACELPWWDGAVGNCSSVMQTFIDQNNTTLSYCGKRADYLGKGQKVISYCLYGDFNRYGTGLPHILQTIQMIYPGWVVRLYTQPQNYTRELVPLVHQYPHLYICDVANLIGGISDMREGNSMLWRTAIMGDELVDVFLSRDIDAVVLEREVSAVNEFLESGKSLHTMVDNPGQRSTIMGGMFGIRQTPSNLELLNSIRKQFIAARLEGKSDQNLMNAYMYPKLKDDMISHNSYSCQKYNDSRPFPTQRENHMFVGNRRYRPGHEKDSVRTECPVQCRPAAHPDWKYC